MKRYTYIIFAVAMLFMVACNSRKSGNDVFINDVENVANIDSLRPDTLHHPSPEDFEEGHMPPPPPDGRGFDGPPPLPPDGKHRPPHRSDNMRGFDPASEDDMDDNGMSRYMENDDDEGWD